MANENLNRPLKQVNIYLHEILMESVRDVQGDFIELGVYQGYSFRPIYQMGLKQKRFIYAVDTFEGFPTSPHKEDNERYPPGEAHGEEYRFQAKFPQAKIYRGEIPDILSKVPATALAFAHLDIDHEYSTYPALHWVWERLLKGGIVIIHDFGRSVNKHASKAVKRWMEDTGLNYVGICDNTIFFKKGVS